MTIPIIDIQNLFSNISEEILNEFQENKEQIKPILETLTILSTNVAKIRLQGRSLPALEKSIAQTLLELETLGLIKIRKAWEEKVTLIFNTLTKVLVGVISAV